MKLFIFLVFVLLGIGRNLPFQELYFFGLGIADFLFCILFLFSLLIPKARQGLLHESRVLRIPILATGYIGALAMISLAFNAPIYGVEGKDIFEILKYFYLVTVMVVTSHYTRTTGVVPVVGFVVGVIVSGVVAFLNPMNPDVLGIPQIFNPNVIGNILSVSIVFCSFLILAGYPVGGGLLAICAALIAFFTFSKGTWLMSTLALIACFLALKSLGSRNTSSALKYGKFLTYLLFASLLYVVFVFWDVVSLIVEAKIVATDFEASAAEGGSFSARVGLILSAIYMFLMNPLLGVGISNFEHVNHLLERDLGNAYYEDDNPNSAWFYVLACMGLPAFILFIWVFYWFLRRLYRLPFVSPKTRFLYTTCIGIIFFIGGNIQLEMLTAYYYWVAIGVVAALREPLGKKTLKKPSNNLEASATGVSLV